MLFESPTTRRKGPKTNTAPTGSHELHKNLLRTVQPLKRRYPDIIPVQRMHPTTFSLGIQPYIEPSTTRLSQAPLNPNWIYAASLASPHSSSFMKFLLAFTAGGLFFSTALAGFMSCYAVGVDNVRRFLDILVVIVQRVWITFTLGLGATKLALLGEEEVGKDGTSKHPQWHWKSAWTVLKEKMLETRVTAMRGVQALRQEAKLYTAAVGAPGLIPLQYMLDRFMPLSLAEIMEDSIIEALSSTPAEKTIQKMTLSKFEIGNATPTLEAARVYDVEDAIAFDYDVRWESELEATVNVHTAFATVPVVLKNFSFQGSLRVILTPLIRSSPGYGAMLLSLSSVPKISLDARVLGGEIPFLQQEITAAIHKSLTDEWLWPRRNVVPSLTPGGTNPILNSHKILQLKLTDPLLQAEEALSSQQPLLKQVHDTRITIDEQEKAKMLQIKVEDREKKSKSSNSKMNHAAGLDAAIHFPEKMEESEKQNWWQNILQAIKLPQKEKDEEGFEVGKGVVEKNTNDRSNRVQFGLMQEIFRQISPKPA